MMRGLFSFPKERFTLKLTYTTNTNYYKPLSQFKDINDFNNQYRMIMFDIKKYIPKRQHAFLTVLKRFMARVSGVSNIRYEKLVEYAKQHYNVNTSVSSGKRIISLLKRAGIITTYRTHKANSNHLYANVIVFNRYSSKATAKFIELVKSKNELTANGDNVTAPKEGNRIKSTLNGLKNKIGEQIKKIKNELTETVKDKTGKDKLLYTSCHAIKYQSINRKLKVKSNIKLHVNVLANTQDSKLRFISRLKEVIYSSKLNDKASVKAITQSVYGNVRSLTKLPTYKKRESELLERALLIVKGVLVAHRKGQLSFVKNVIGFIDAKIKEELQAITYIEMQRTLKQIDSDTAQTIIDTYSNALDEQRATYERELELYYR